MYVQKEQPQHQEALFPHFLWLWTQRNAAMDSHLNSACYSFVVLQMWGGDTPHTSPNPHTHWQYLASVHGLVLTEQR